jgi:CheY-like chemotaxis protein
MSSPVPSILILAEDDVALRGLIARSLRREGYTVHEAADGRELLSIVQGLEPAPDLVVSDVQMPHLSGPQALSRLRDGGIDCPIVLISAFGGEEARAAAVALGGCVVLDKPVDLPALGRLVKAMLAG